MKPDIREEHEWLRQLTGDWTWEGEMAGPEGKVERWSGTESGRMVGDAWLLSEQRVSTPDGGAATNLVTVGYDSKAGKFVGTFISDTMTHLWVYHGGQLDADGRVLTLEATGPSFTGEGGNVNYRDSVELMGEGRRALVSRVQGPDGQWAEIMRMTYRKS